MDLSLKTDANQCRVRIVSPYAHTHLMRVKPAEQNLSLLSLMSQRFPFRSESVWRDRIQDGLVKLNDQAVYPEVKIRQGDKVTHHNPRVTEPSVPDHVQVLEDQPDYLLVFKPAPMPVHAGGRYFRNTLLEMLKQKGFDNLKVVHRLDSVTSGLMIFGKSPGFSAELQRAFREGDIQKSYLAVVEGEPEQDYFESKLGVRREAGLRFTTDDGPGLKQAHTKFEVIRRMNARALIRCNPVTGRTHQIRLHLADSGFPIADDMLYGKDYVPGVMQNRPIALLSTSLESATLNIQAELPLPEELMDHYLNSEVQTQPA